MSSFFRRKKNLGTGTNKMNVATGNLQSLKKALDQAKDEIHNNPVVKGLCMNQLNAMGNVKNMDEAMEALKNLKTALTSEYKFRLFTDVNKVNLILKEAAGYAGSSMPRNENGNIARIRLGRIMNKNNSTLKVTAANLGMKNNNGNGKANSVNNAQAAEMANQAMSNALVVRNNNSNVKMKNNTNMKKVNKKNNVNNKNKENRVIPYNRVINYNPNNAKSNNENLGGGAKKMKKKTTSKPKTMKKKTKTTKKKKTTKK